MAATDEWRVELRGGVRTSFVSRQYDDAAADVAHESQVLSALEDVDLPTPRFVAAEGSVLLMTKLPGHMDLMPRELDTKLTRIAEALPVLHAASALVPLGTPAVIGTRSYDWVRDAGLRAAAEELIATPPRRVARVPSHSDYQHFNMLWSRGRMTGLVDWSGIWLGPPEIDVCHCRLNLAVLYSVDIAERFRVRYESVSGRRVDPWHDVHRIGVYNRGWPGFIPKQVAGRAPIPPRMTHRIEQLLRVALARV